MWTSRGSTNRSKASIWAPVFTKSMLATKKSELICVGHYPSAWWGNPTKRAKAEKGGAKPAEPVDLYLIEVTDATSGVFSSGTIDLRPVVDELFPHPIRCVDLALSPSVLLALSHLVPRGSSHACARLTPPPFSSPSPIWSLGARLTRARG